MNNKKMSLNDKILNVVNIIAIIAMICSIPLYFIYRNMPNNYAPFLGIAAVLISTIIKLHLLTKDTAY